jgi:hypothetical protein
MAVTEDDVGGHRPGDGLARRVATAAGFWRARYLKITI